MSTTYGVPKGKQERLARARIGLDWIDFIIKSRDVLGIGQSRLPNKTNFYWVRPGQREKNRQRFLFCLRDALNESLVSPFSIYLFVVFFVLPNGKTLWTYSLHSLTRDRCNRGMERKFFAPLLCTDLSVCLSVCLSVYVSGMAWLGLVWLF